MKELKVHGVVTASHGAVANALPNLLGRFIDRGSAHANMYLEISPHAIAELAATPINSKHLSAADERWYPRFHGTIALVPLHDDRTDVTVKGVLEHGSAPLTDAHYERETTQQALQALVHLLQRHFNAKNDVQFHSGRL